MNAAFKASHTLLARILDRVFPKVPDFFQMLTEQNLMVARTVDLLVEYMEHDGPEVADALKLDVHEADLIKVRNLHELNDAFSTPIDREDIYRAIMAMDDVVMYCKTTVHEMDVLGVKPDRFMKDISQHIKDGMDALSQGYALLAKRPAEAADFADTARKAERRAEAKAKGYEGEMCSECGNFTLVRNGTCMKCDTCGSTTGGGDEPARLREP
jgi:uncharacterized protein Yka (UPF0111/DUF47 family)